MMDWDTRDEVRRIAKEAAERAVEEYKREQRYKWHDRFAFAWFAFWGALIILGAALWSGVLK